MPECGWIISDQILLSDNIAREFFVRYDIIVERNTVVNAKSIAFRKVAIMESDMLTLMTEHVVANEIKDGHLVRINLERLEHDFPAGIIYSVRGSQPTAVLELIRKIRAACQGLGTAPVGRTLDPALADRPNFRPRQRDQNCRRKSQRHGEYGRILGRKDGARIAQDGNPDVRPQHKSDDRRQQP
ncbi:MAG: hypothetical protein EXQ84_06085, partial [Rhodospirillaceae bacterium]|nr:hypothetical protein [Rhodospirillaceae bacterium]